MAYIRIRMIEDSKHRGSGPYGPYAYLGWREGTKICEQYLGKCASIGDMLKLRKKHGFKIFTLVQNAIMDAD